MAYYFYFKYDDENESLQLPIPPESLTTRVGNKNKTVETIALGEVNLVKLIGLRELSFKALLPFSLELPFVQVASGEKAVVGNKAIDYLNRFREFKKSERPIRFMIIREMPDGTPSFQGNLLVSFEDYVVTETGIGDYEVDIKLKEYRSISRAVLNDTGRTTADGKRLVAKAAVQDGEQKVASEYIVRKGDSLWVIAKLRLGDGARYAEIARLNGISNPNCLGVGQRLRLPTE